MPFQDRAKRWPSAWQVVLYVDGDPPQGVLAEFRNVSSTGCRFTSESDLPLGTRVQFAIERNLVTGHVVRLARVGGAISFTQALTTRQLNNLRQVRTLSRSVTSGPKPAQSDEDLLQAISTIL